MADLIAHVIVVLALALATVGLLIGVFAGGLFLYFLSWRSSLKEPGEP